MNMNMNMNKGKLWHEISKQRTLEVGLVKRAMLAALLVGLVLGVVHYGQDIWDARKQGAVVIVWGRA